MQTLPAKLGALLAVTALATLLACEANPPSAAEQDIGNEDPLDTSCRTTGCDDGDGCTVDLCELFAGTYSCHHYPRQCPAGQSCDAERGACVECRTDVDCSDGQYCSGAEVCSDGFCQSGTPPCPQSACDELEDACVECLGDGDCDDAVYCNGPEQCHNGVCSNGIPPCPAEQCDESLGLCADAFSARISGCPTTEYYPGVPVMLGAILRGGVGEHTRIEWSLEATDATIDSTASSSIQLLIPQAQNVRVSLVATDYVDASGAWTPRSQSTAECVLPESMALAYLAESPVSGVLPQDFTARGGTIEVSVSPVGIDGGLIVEDLTLANFAFREVTVTRLDEPQSVITTAQVAPSALEVIEPGDPTKGVTATITLDSTGSMQTNDPQRLRVDAAQALVEQLTERDLAAVLEFSRSASPSPGFFGARLLQPLTNDHALLDAAIAAVTADGTTPLYDALLDSCDLLVTEGRVNSAVVVLTDGLENASTTGTLTTVIATAVDHGIPVFPIGLGANIDFAELQTLADATGGTFATALNAAELDRLFRSLGVAVTKGRTIITASVTFTTPIGGPGVYTVAGDLETRMGQQRRVSPFSFQVTLGNPALVRFQSAASELR